MAKTNQRLAEVTGELDGRAKAAEATAERLRADYLATSSRMVTAEQRVERLEEEAKMAERDSDHLLHSKALEQTRILEEAAAEAAAHKKEAAKLKAELEAMRTAAAQAEARRKQYAQRVATARFEAEEVAARDEAAVEEEEAEVEAALHARLSRGGIRRTAGASGGGLRSPAASARLVTSSPGTPEWRGGRGAVESAILQMELGVCETRIRESEQRELLQAARHRSIVEPLVAQREQEVAWWRAELESERQAMLDDAQAERERLTAEWSDKCDAMHAENAARCEVLEAALGERESEVHKLVQANATLHQEVVVLRGSLASRERAASIEMLPPPTPTLQQSRPSQSVSMAPPTTPAAAEFGTPGTTACAADYSYGSCAPRADAPTALGAQEPNVMTPGEACSASLHERNQQFKARLAKMGGRRGR